MRRFFAAIAALIFAAVMVACTRASAPAVPMAASSEATMSEAAMPEVTMSEAAPSGEAEAPDPYYLELVQDKAELVELVASRVDIYRTGDPSTLSPNHHMLWPEGFPPVATLPVIETTADFSVRHTQAGSEALGGVYLAVSLGEGYELRMSANRMQQADGLIAWGSGDTWFSQKDALDWTDWVHSDVE